MSTRNRSSVIASLVLLCTATAVAMPATAQEKQNQASPSSSILDESAFDASFSKLPTTISADNLTLNAKTRVFTYKGNVTVTQGDMTLTSKTLEGTYSDTNQIQKIVARGDVRIVKQDINATSQQAFYDAGDATIVLTDNPQLQQGESMLTADKIKVFLNENRSQAEGSVRVTLVQKEGGKGGGLPLGQLTGSDKNKATTEPAPRKETPIAQAKGNKQPKKEKR